MAAASWKAASSDYAFNPFTCGHDPSTSTSAAPAARRCLADGSFFLPLPDMECSTIDEVLGDASFSPSSLEQLLSADHSEQFVRIYLWEEQTERAVVMHVVDQHTAPEGTDRCSPPSPQPPGFLIRSSKRQKCRTTTAATTFPQHLPLGTARVESFPTSYDSFQCGCLHSRCSCVYPRLHGVMLSALGEHSCWSLRAVHWLDWMRRQRRLGSKRSRAKLLSVWSEWHHDDFRAHLLQ